METVIEKIKQKIDIIEFISSFIPVKKAGRNFKANCPFHNEKTPSFVISPERQIWHCFGACGEGGDIVKFLMKWENITFFEALKELSEKTGIPLETKVYTDSGWKKKERFLQMNILASDFFSFILEKTSFGKKAYDYLVSRKINNKTIKTFRLGYSPQSWDSLLQFLKKKLYSEEEMFENGLLVKSDKGRYYDRFRGRLMFPIFDPRNQILAFSGRSLDSNDSSAKYINTPESSLYHKRETLYGIQLAKDSIKKEKNVYIVEGEFDMISPFQQGYENFVAIKGSALTREQLMYLKRYTNKITLSLDADEAGEEAIKRAIEEAEKLDFEIQIISFDYAKDPDEAVNKDPIQFKQVIKYPLPIYDFLIELSKKKFPDDDPFSKKKIGELILPYIERINNPIVQSYYVKKIAEMLEVSEKSIESLMRRFTMKKKQTSGSSFQKKKDETESSELKREKFLLSALFQDDSNSIDQELLFSTLKEEYFIIPSYGKLMKKYQIYKKTATQENTIFDFVKLLPEELKAVFDELFLYASVEIDSKQENFYELVFRVKRNYLKRTLKKYLNQEAENENKKILTQLNDELKEVEKKLGAL